MNDQTLESYSIHNYIKWGWVLDTTAVAGSSWAAWYTCPLFGQDCPTFLNSLPEAPSHNQWAVEQTEGYFFNCVPITRWHYAKMGGSSRWLRPLSCHSDSKRSHFILYRMSFCK